MGIQAREPDFFPRKNNLLRTQAFFHILPQASGEDLPQTVTLLTNFHLYWISPRNSLIKQAVAMKSSSGDYRRP